jgi:hypothetical protein
MRKHAVIMVPSEPTLIVELSKAQHAILDNAIASRNRVGFLILSLPMRHWQRSSTGGGRMRALLGVRRIGAALALALGTALFAAPSPAFADWDDPSCYAAPYTWCATRAIPAHRSQHWVRIKVSWPGGYEVRDLDTNVVVGKGGGNGKWMTIYGLYGERYRLKVTAFGREAARGTIANCTSGCKNH